MAEGYKIEDRWCRLIPLLHRILSNSSAPSKFPDPTRTTELSEACSVWETLHYLFKALLGWENLAEGLSWWYQHGQPTHDSELLKTVSQIWGRNDALDFYAAWAWNTSDPTVAGMSDDSSFPDDDWWRVFRVRPKPEWRNPYYGGSNPLHLGHSDSFLEGDSPRDEFKLYHEVTTRTAVLIVNHISHWRNALRELKASLPELGKRSWHVQVFDRQYGLIGVFRQSRVTGRWFQGKHSIHMKGNPVSDGTS